MIPAVYPLLAEFLGGSALSKGMYEWLSKVLVVIRLMNEIFASLIKDLQLVSDRKLPK